MLLLRKGRFCYNLVLVVIFIITASCIENNSKRTKSQGATYHPKMVDIGHARILEDNPIILSNYGNLSSDYNLSLLFGPNQEFITDKQFLIGDCNFSDNTIARDCFYIKNKPNDNYLVSILNRWGFLANTEEFLQVNSFAHVNRIVKKFLKSLAWGHDRAYTSMVANYSSSLPFLLNDNSIKAFWFGDKKLSVFSNCDIADNAYYDMATTSICMGHLSQYPNIYFAHDSTIIYHEMGHAFIQIMLNLRNLASGLNTETDLGYIFYDEAGVIGEGVSDFFSYFINKRTHIGEWALGNFLEQSRPMSEREDIHIAGLDTSFGSRLSYPDYVNYDPNYHNELIEDVHIGGQIVSHFLVAFVEDLVDACSYEKDHAIEQVVILLAETFAHLGDQTSLSIDGNTNLIVNLNQIHSSEWIRINNPINLRSFAQTLARKTMAILGDANANDCNDSIYPKDRLEKLWDGYGLLLFKNYNENGNGEVVGHVGNTSLVSELNRRISSLILKDLLILDPRNNAISAWIFDKPGDMKKSLSLMQQSGQVTELSPVIPGDLRYNNSNGRISPGELVGVAINLYNNSNLTMGGVHILANDWDHTKDGKPCNNFSDNWPSTSEGGVNTSSESGNSPGECKYITRSNGDEVQEELSPVCFLQVSDEGASKWVNQEVLVDDIALDAKNCLGGESKRSDCFVRVLKGADQSYYSRIDSKKNWAETLYPDGNNIKFLSSSIIFFEVSPWIPPGTRFLCRLRARFSNCEDCYIDNSRVDKDDFLDYQYSGGDPFKIIHFEFTVND